MYIFFSHTILKQKKTKPNIRLGVMCAKPGGNESSELIDAALPTMYVLGEINSTNRLECSFSNHVYGIGIAE
jgi:hypothetical protein